MPNGQNGGNAYRFDAGAPLTANAIPSPVHTSESEETYDNKVSYYKAEIQHSAQVEERLLPPVLRVSEIMRLVGDFLVPGRLRGEIWL